METIYEQNMESPVMITSGHYHHHHHHKHQQKFMMQHGKNLANTGKPMTPVSPLSPADSTSSKSPTSPSSLAKKPSQIMREWVKRSGPGSGAGQNRTAKHAATLSVPGHQRLPIVHLGGGRLGESDIEPSFPTGLRPTTRNSSIQRESSADSRVTQWIDLYPEAIERMEGNGMARMRQSQQQHQQHQQMKHTRTMSESSTIKQTRWKFHPDHHAAAPPEIDPRPAPLRIPSAKKKPATPENEAAQGHPPTTTTLVRSDSKWKPLPILPARQQPTGQVTTTTTTTQVLGKPGSGNGMPARKPLQTPHIAEAIQLPKRKSSSEKVTITRPKTPVPTKKPSSPGPGFPPPLTIYVTPPPTPDNSENGETTTDPAPKLISGPPALRINTGNPTPLSTTTTIKSTEQLSNSKPVPGAELPASDAPRVLSLSLASPTTQSDSLLSADMDDAFKITIGMMCLGDLDLDLRSGEGGQPRPGVAPDPGSTSHSRPQTETVILHAGAERQSPGDLSLDLDSPLASIPRLFSPVTTCSGTTFSPPPPPPPPAAAVTAIATEPVTPVPIPSGVTSPTHSQSIGKRGVDTKQIIQSPAVTKSPQFILASPVSASTSKSPANITSSSTPTSIKSPIIPSVASPIREPTTTTTATTTATIPPYARTRYTKEERMWLHQHYRGEAPFLRAWGLDIKNPAEREEGVAILRDLMGMEAHADGS